MAGLFWIALALAVAGQAVSRQPMRPPDMYFAPTRDDVADAMLQLAGVDADDVVYDLGSGDGRIVILAAQKYGARGVGIEIDPRLVDISRQVAREGEAEHRVTFILPLARHQSPTGTEAPARASPRRPHRLAPVSDWPLAAGQDDPRRRRH